MVISINLTNQGLLKRKVRQSWPLDLLKQWTDYFKQLNVNCKKITNVFLIEAALCGTLQHNYIIYTYLIITYYNNLFTHINIYEIHKQLLLYKGRLQRSINI